MITITVQVPSAQVPSAQAPSAPKPRRRKAVKRRKTASRPPETTVAGNLHRIGKPAMRLFRAIFRSWRGMDGDDT